MRFLMTVMALVSLLPAFAGAAAEEAAEVRYVPLQPAFVTNFFVQR